MYDIYLKNHDDSWRFALGKDGSRKLLTIGLNPSTATKEKSDTTVAKVEEVAKRNGFDGFVMLNLYPIRSTNYNALPLDTDPEAFHQNLRHIKKLVSSESKPTLWAAWGESIYARPYFISAAKELFSILQKHSPSWQHFGSMTNSGHPRHPSRLNYAWSFSQFDSQGYLGSIHAK